MACKWPGRGCAETMQRLAIDGGVSRGGPASRCLSLGWGSRPVEPQWLENTPSRKSLNYRASQAAQLTLSPAHDAPVGRQWDRAVSHTAVGDSIPEALAPRARSRLVTRDSGADRGWASLARGQGHHFGIGTSVPAERVLLSHHHAVGELSRWGWWQADPLLLGGHAHLVGVPLSRPLSLLRVVVS